MSDSDHLYYEGQCSSDTALVSFAGRAGYHGGIPTFEFSSILSGINAHKLYLRDPHLIWYQRGIPGIGEDIDEIAEWLDDFLDRRGIKYTVFIGNSAGAYAALVFGALLSASRIHAFAPQTRLKKPKDSHSDGAIKEMLSDPKANRQYLNVRDVLEGCKIHERPYVDVYYARNNKIDNRHVRRIEGIKGIKGHPISYNDHTLARHLKHFMVLKLLLKLGTWSPSYSEPGTYILCRCADMVIPVADKLKKVKKSIKLPFIG
jgi:hypothetical protein